MPDSPVRKIIHIDMDIRRAARQSGATGRPVAVGYAAKRGVVAAASYEARAFGVRSAMPSATARRQCADLVFVAPRFDAYRAVSRQIYAILADYTGLIESLSLDEAFLDVSENRRSLPTASATAKEIRARIVEETRLTASAGISYATTSSWPSTRVLEAERLASSSVRWLYSGPTTEADCSDPGQSTAVAVKGKLNFLGVISAISQEP